MRINIKNVIKIILLLQFPVLCQYNGNDFSIGVYGVYTTSASIFLNPNASDVVIRNQAFVLEDILNPAADIRVRVSEPLIIGLNIEYIEKTESSPNLTAFVGGSVVRLKVEDGFNLIPVELTAYYVLPFSTEGWKFLMGGGLGYYNGEFIRKVADTEVSTVQREAEFGIQVSASMDFVPINQIVIRFQMKFRDPEFTVTSQYDQQEIDYQGHTILLPGDSFDTKINMDGITFMLGAAVQF
jgi:hypothetical protein